MLNNKSIYMQFQLPINNKFKADLLSTISSIKQKFFDNQ